MKLLATGVKAIMKTNSTKRDITKSNILKAARDLFIKDGYIATDIGHIAKAVRVDRRTIYRYFESKEALAFAVWMDVLSDVMKIGEDCAGDTGFERLENMLNKYIDQAIENQDMIKFLGVFDHVFSGEYPDVHEADDFINYIRKTDSAVKKYIMQGIKDKSVRSDIDGELCAAAVSNMMMSLSQRVIIRQEHLVQEQGYSIQMLKSAKDIILKGIKA